MSIEKILIKDLSDKIFEGMMKWEERKNGFLSSRFLFCTVLIVLIGGITSSLYFSGVTDDVFLVEVLPLISLVFLSLILLSLLHRCHTLYTFRGEMKKLLVHYNILGKKISVWASKRSLKNPLQLPESLFQESIKYLSSPEKMILFSVDSSCRRVLIKSDMDTLSLHIDQFFKQMWRPLEEARKREYDRQLLNQKYRDEWMQAVYSLSYDLEQRQEIFYRGPVSDGPMPGDTSLIEMHSECQRLHNLLFLNVLEKIQKELR